MVCRVQRRRGTIGTRHGAARRLDGGKAVASTRRGVGPDRAVEPDSGRERTATDRLATLERRSHELGVLVADMDSQSERAREQLAATLHDDVLQPSLAALMQVRRMREIDPDEPALRRVETLLVQSLAGTRTALGTAAPLELDHLRNALEVVRYAAERLRVEPDLVGSVGIDVPATALGADVKVSLFRAVTAAVRYVRSARGAGRPYVLGRSDGDSIRLNVAAAVDMADPASCAPGDGSHVALVREHLAGLGGELRIADRPGRVAVRLALPIR